MATRSNSSRERILASAEQIILRKGYSSTSIEEIIDSAAITKGGFFYHFDSKIDLAEALIDRYLVADAEIFKDLLARADELSEDPLHQTLIFLKLLAEKMVRMEETHPGCLVASFTYEIQHFHESLRERMCEGLLKWRQMALDRLAMIDEHYEMSGEVSAVTAADMFSSVIEGGIILARNFNDNELLAQQILAYRSFLKMIYGVR